MALTDSNNEQTTTFVCNQNFYHQNAVDRQRMVGFLYNLAENNNKFVQVFLAGWLEHGFNLEQDEKEAETWYKTALEWLYMPACLKLIHFYETRSMWDESYRIRKKKKYMNDEREFYHLRHSNQSKVFNESTQDFNYLEDILKLAELEEHVFNFERNKGHFSVIELCVFNFLYHGDHDSLWCLKSFVSRFTANANTSQILATSESYGKTDSDENTHTDSS